MTKQPSRKEYRNFAWIVGGILAVIFGLVIPWLESAGPRRWPLYGGALLAALGAFFPLWLGPVYRLWMKIGHALGHVNNFILLHIVFYCIFTPMAFLLRLFRWKSPVKEALNPKATTYRAASVAQPEENMEEIF